MHAQGQRPPVIASLLLVILCLYLQVIPAVAFPGSTPEANDTDYIRACCGATLYPEICYTSLSPYASAVHQRPRQLALLAIRFSLSEARRMAAYISNLTQVADGRAAEAVHDCYSNFSDAVDEISGSLKQIRQLGESGSVTAESFRFCMGNVQTWMSAALTDEETCTDGFEEVVDGTLKTDVCNRTADVKKFTSNALALVNSYAAKGIP